MYDTYWKFAYERQNIFFKRLNQEFPPWTLDPILQSYKFTNAYRASDRVSQYLIKNVIYNSKYSDQDLLFRILLFKTFNKIETWQFLNDNLGDITYSDFNFDKYVLLLDKLVNAGTSIYSGAYIMASGKSSFGYNKKHLNHLALLQKMMNDNIVAKIHACKKMENVFDLLKSYPTIGSFLAYQYCIDINYSNIISFSEMEFVVPGPGARDGINKCFSNVKNLKESDIILMMAENQDIEFERLQLNFKNLFGRKLQLIDCQNLFCEVDKYSRVAHPEYHGISDRKRIKQKFRQNDGFNYFYPPKWNINRYIMK